MKDTNGTELRVGDLVAFAKKGRQVGEIATGVITKIGQDRWKQPVAAIEDTKTLQLNYRRCANEFLWLAHP